MSCYLKISIFFCVFLVSLYSSADSSLQIYESESVIIANPESSNFVFNPNIFIFDDSGWEKEVAIRELDKASKILSQCGIVIGNVTIHYITSPPEGPRIRILPFKKIEGVIYKKKSGKPFSTIHFGEIAQSFIDYKPMVVLVEQASSFGVGSGFGEFAKDSIIPEFRLLNGTAFIGIDAVKHPEEFGDLPEEYRHESYSTMAHEIGHLLNLLHDHKRSGNIMSFPYNLAKGRLSLNPYMGEKGLYMSQCDRIRESPWLNRRY